jgi:hypothetical protein
VGVTNSCPRGSAWWMAWPARCSPSWRVLGCSSGSGSALHGGACRCLGQQPRAAPPLSPSAWLSAAAFAIVSSDTTAHASCFGAGLLRIALCSANACFWSLSFTVPTKGDHMRWNSVLFVSPRGDVVQGGDSWSRIDLIYTPDEGDEFWHHAPRTDFFPKKVNRVELDHVAVCVQYESTPKRDRGSICNMQYAIRNAPQSGPRIGLPKRKN